MNTLPEKLEIGMKLVCPRCGPDAEIVEVAYIDDQGGCLLIRPNGVAVFGLFTRQQLADYDYEIVKPEACTKCGEHQGMHKIFNPDKSAENLCCKCYVESGNPPTEWHSLCMQTSQETTEKGDDNTKTASEIVDPGAN